MTKKEPKAEPQTEQPVEQVILDYQQDKYSAIPLASVWANELHRREENRHLTTIELLEKALRDVMSGDVDWKSVRKAVAASASEAPAAPAAETKKSKE